MILTLANILTLSRIVLVPFFLAAFIKGWAGWALAIFCIAGATDLIDGTVARLFSRPSKWGAILDPMADKFLVQSCFIALGVTGVLPWWFVVLAFTRDLVIIVGIVYLRYKDAPLPYRPTIVSKFATLFQLALAVIALVALWKPVIAFGNHSLMNVLMWTMYATAILILISGVQYVSIGLELIRNRKVQRAT